MKMFFAVVSCFFFAFSAIANETPSVDEKTAIPSAETDAETATDVSASSVDEISPERQKQIDEILAYSQKFLGQKKSNISYLMKVTQPKKTKTLRLFFKNNKMRIETTIYEGVLHAISKTVILFDGETAFIYLPDYNIAKSGTLNNTDITLPSLDETNVEKYVLGDMTTVNGYECRMMTSEELHSSLCFSEKYLLPITVKTGIYGTDISEISDEPLSDDLFTVPPSVFKF